MIEDELQKYKEYESKQQETFHSGSESIYYLISTHWLNRWKLKVGYDGAPPTNEILPAINGDIGYKAKAVLKYDPIDAHMWNTQLKPDLVQGVDYEVISQGAWKMFKHKYRAEFTLERDSYLDENNQRVINAHLKRVKFVPFYPGVLNKLRGGRKETLIEGDQYMPANCKVSQYVELLEKTLRTVTSAKFLDKESVRLYKLPENWTMAQLTAMMSEQLKDFKNNEDARLVIPEAEYLDPHVYKTIEDCGFQSEQIMIMDAKQWDKSWVIQDPRFPIEEKCTSCSFYKILQVQCDCLKVKYCSENCRNRDEYFHFPTCPKQEDDDNLLLTLVESNTSRKGQVGLRNLGNTCFMNSAIQCLSHTHILSRYFLDNSYKLEINTNNPLGTKGMLANKFAYLLKRLWFDSKLTLSPYAFKNLIGEVQPQFKGIQQHDAQEFITFLLDTLHEDLNRINVKPYIEIPDANGRPEYEVATEQWQIFKQRNNSAIVDSLYGLYRSQLQCPTCAKLSITFDPFLMVSVSIPQDSRKQIKVEIIDDNCIWNTTEQFYLYDGAKNLKIKDVLEEKAQEWLNCKEEEIIMTCSSTFNYEDVFYDEMIHILKKKLKFKKLYLRKQSAYELAIPTEDRVSTVVHCCHLQQGGFNWKKEMVPPLNFVFSKQSTYEEIHLLLYKHYKQVLCGFYDFDQEWLNPVDEKLCYLNFILDKFWSISFKTNQRFGVDCSYCYKSYCNDCTMGMSDKVFGECLTKADKLLQPEIQITWLKPFKRYGRVDDVYEDFCKENVNQPHVQPVQIIKSKDDVQYTLEYCLEYSSKPEQLAEDNSWFCSNCQDHVQALKTLQIYKAPKILVFNLKRFKDSYKLFKSKLQTKVTFPVDNFDVRPFIINDKLPQEFENGVVDADIEHAPVLYDLYAVSNHIGGLGGGHYTAYCKNSGDWYKFDDNYVTKEYGDIVTQHAYVLFYKRKDVKDDYDFNATFQANYNKVEEIIKNQQIQAQEAQVNQKEQQEPQPQPKPSDQVDTNGNDDAAQYEEHNNVNIADIEDDTNNYGDSIEADYDETYPND